MPARSGGHRVSAVGHAHLDTAWLWPLRETVRKCARTFATAVSLMDEYPEYRFACSQAVHLAWTKEHYPDLFERIRIKVATGQFEPTGSMWVEPDCNLPGGESLVRQLVYGKRFFLDEFGIETRDAWLPDVFGFTAALPQIFRRAGVEWFLTQKLSWNQYNVMPHHSFQWEGIDGSRVFAHFPPADTYGGNMTVDELRKGVDRFLDHGIASRSLYPFGHGDGGGGPTAEMLEAARRMGDLDGVPPVVIEGPRAFFEAAAGEAADWPVWVGELYLELHRGTYTTHADVKLGNRQGELALREAELWAATLLPAAEYPGAELEDSWKTLLLHQFHDILPGSGIHWVYEDSARDHAAVLDDATDVVDRAVTALVDTVDTTGHVQPVVVLNATAHDRSGLLEIDGEAVALVDVPACGYAVHDLASPLPERETPALSAGTDHLENERLRLELDGDGLLTSVYDKVAGREALAPGARANLFQLHPDRPNFFDAWDVDRFAFDTVEELTGLDSIEVVESSPLRVALRVTRSFGSSRVTQRISLATGSSRIDFATEVDWHESHRFLKVAFPVAVHSPRATYEIQFGHLERPTHENTSWDLARFEVSAQQWADLSEGDYGVALLNDCKYGYDVARQRAPALAATGPDVARPCRRPRAPPVHLRAAPPHRRLPERWRDRGGTRAELTAVVRAGRRPHRRPSGTRVARARRPRRGRRRRGQAGRPGAGRDRAPRRGVGSAHADAARAPGRDPRRRAHRPPRARSRAGRGRRRRGRARPPPVRARDAPRRALTLA